MEDIKNNFDRIMAEFNDSVTHTAPKKLYFDSLREDSSTFGRKRRYQETDDADKTSNSDKKNDGKVPPSPWETRRLKADLIEANARILGFKQEISRLKKIREETETLYSSKVSELTEQCQFTSSKVQDLEQHLGVVRKREHAAKQEVIKLQREVAQKKLETETIVRNLHREKEELADSARQYQMRTESEIARFKLLIEQLQGDVNLLSDELKGTKSQLAECKKQVEGYQELKMENENQQQDLENARSRIKELEFEISNYKDWKEITQNTQKTLISVDDMTRELQYLREKNARLNELIGNKLLLEEQVYDLRKRLEKEEGGKAEAIQLKVKMEHVEKELCEWMKVAQDHCLPNTIVSPLTLRTRIEQLLQRDIILASEKGANTQETKAMQAKLLEYKERAEAYAKNNEDLNVALRRYKTQKDRIQKRLVLVSRERDCYKQLVENFEKDLTISNPNEITSQEAQLRARLEMLERTLIGYKEMCGTLEKESSDKEQQSGSIVYELCESGKNLEEFENIKRELRALRFENERLRSQKHQIELELENRRLREEGNVELRSLRAENETLRYRENELKRELAQLREKDVKVVHLKGNPADEAYAESHLIVEKLQAEIVRLKLRNKKREEDFEATQARMNDNTTSNVTMNFKEINQLRAELDSTNAKIKKLKECYKTSNHEFREVVYLLFGYKVDRVGLSSNYSIISMYAESPEQILNFRFVENDHASSQLQMLDNPYSQTLTTLIETTLVKHESLPVFLSNLTLELFQQTTVTMSATAMITE